jgi:hypothetical protein
METNTPTIKTRKPRTVKASAPHVAEMKKAMSAALKAEHSFTLAAGKIEKQIEQFRQALEDKRTAVKTAWLNVEQAAVKCVAACDV